MPRTDLYVYRGARGDSSPLKEWLATLEKRQAKIYAKCVAFILELGEEGGELRPPTSKCLRDGIFELRPKNGRVNYRILYFFHARPRCAVLSHGFTKEGEVPDIEIERAIRRRTEVTGDFERHTLEWEI